MFVFLFFSFAIVVTVVLNPRKLEVEVDRMTFNYGEFCIFELISEVKSKNRYNHDLFNGFLLIFILSLIAMDYVNCEIGDDSVDGYYTYFIPFSHVDEPFGNIYFDTFYFQNFML